MYASWKANHDRRHELRQRREQQDRLNRDLELHPLRRAGYGKNTGRPPVPYGRPQVVHISHPSEPTSRLVLHEEWMLVGDWLPWPHDPEADERDRRAREEREEHAERQHRAYERRIRRERAAREQSGPPPAYDSLESLPPYGDEKGGSGKA